MRKLNNIIGKIFGKSDTFIMYIRFDLTNLLVNSMKLLNPYIINVSCTEIFPFWC